MHVRTIGLALAGVVSATALTACGSGGGGSSAQSLPSTPPPVTATTASQSTSAVVTADDANTDSNAAPIATRTGTYDGAEVRVDVQSLRRDGELSTLQLRVTNLGTDEYSVNHDFGDVTNYDVSGVTLIDGKNSKRYLVGHDSKDRCVCSSTLGLRIKPRTSYTLSATYAAPPAEVTRLDLSIPGLGTVHDVPVS